MDAALKNHHLAVGYTKKMSESSSRQHEVSLQIITGQNKYPIIKYSHCSLETLLD